MMFLHHDVGTECHNAVCQTGSHEIRIRLDLVRLKAQTICFGELRTIVTSGRFIILEAYVIRCNLYKRLEDNALGLLKS